MKTFETDSVKGRNKFEAAVIREIGAGYNPDSWRDPGGVQWSLTEILLSDTRTARAALCLLTGYDTTGGLLSSERAIQDASRRIPLKVLSRRACYRDATGKILDTNPRSPGCIPIDAEPQTGDVVRVPQGMLSRHPETGEVLTPATRAHMALMGHDLKAYHSYMVRPGGYIETDIPDALYMLTQRSRLSYRPQITQMQLVSQGTVGATVTEVKILNWLFEETAIPAQEPENVYPSGRGAVKK
jgi:hypothetical protein